MLAYQVVKDGFLEQHVRCIREVYRQRRDTMLAALEEFCPEGVTWTRPEGGLFLWVRLPEHLDAREVLDDALAEKVAFVPGSAFYTDGRGLNTMRLNFSNAEPELLREGIRRLARAIARRLEPVRIVVPA
jgi:2-aminoadipate transaminase